MRSEARGRLLLQTALVFLLHVVPADGNAKLEIRFHGFSNPGQLKADGFCCDGERRGSNCTGTCDYSLQLCLGSSDRTPCDIVTFDAGTFDVSASGEVSFVSGLSTLVPFDIPVWQGRVLVSLQVLDEDTRNQEVVDTFRLAYARPTPVRDGPLTDSDYTTITLHGQRHTEPTSLSLEVGVMCERFYYSDNCSVNCVPSDDCGGHYDCDVITGRRVCLRGWGGDTCNTQLSPDHGCSADQICEHGSTCVPYGQHRYYCCCDSGFTGQNCQTDIDECASRPCLNGAQCSQSLPGTYLCNCTDRYKGLNCEQSKTCADRPCVNQGRCTPLMAGSLETFYCSCPPAYTGDTCEVPLTTSPTTTPVTTTSTSTTIPCPENYYGEDCREYCSPADDCTGHYGCDVHSGRKLCVPGWEGENCTVSSVPDPSCQCQNGGHCFRDTCCCAPGYTGPWCERPISFCHENTCLNHGTCTEDASGVQCVCEEGFTGERCENELESPACPENYYGPSCTVYCEPQATCEAGQYTCNPINGQKVCGFGWTGPECDARDPSARHEVECPDSQCRNGGVCVNNTCCCQPGYTGSLCHIEVLECASNPCTNGGRCRDLIGDYSCDCQSQFSGKNCELGQTVPGVTSTDSTADLCYGVECVHNGTCVRGKITGFICLCQEGFTGEFCQDSVNQLTTPANTQHPTCPPNYFGPNCEVFCDGKDSCSEGHYHCDRQTGHKVCRNGWAGHDCKHRIVSPDSDPECPLDMTCKNEGTCFNGTCCCHDRYTGEYCQIEQLPCDSSPCLNGVCLDLLSDFQCSCHPGFSGPNCETFIGFPETTSSSGGTDATGISSTPGGFNTTVESTTLRQNSTMTDAGHFNTIPQSTPSSGSQESTLSGSKTPQSTASTDSSSAGLLCGSKVCYNGGQCHSFETGAYNCSCPSDYTGQQCETAVSAASSNVTSLPTSTSQSTSIEGILTSSGHSNSVVCGSRICFNGATCSSTGNDTCDCSQGFQGRYCETPVTTTSAISSAIEANKTQGTMSPGVSGLTTAAIQLSTAVTSGSSAVEVTDNQGGAEMTTLSTSLNNTSHGTKSTLMSGNQITRVSVTSSNPDNTVQSQATQTLSRTGSTTSSYSGTSYSHSIITGTTETSSNASMSTESSVVGINTTLPTSSGGVAVNESTTFTQNASQRHTPTQPQNSTRVHFTVPDNSANVTPATSTTGSTNTIITPSAGGSGGVISNGTTTGSTNTIITPSAGGSGGVISNGTTTDTASVTTANISVTYHTTTHNVTTTGSSGFGFSSENTTKSADTATGESKSTSASTVENFSNGTTESTNTSSVDSNPTISPSSSTQRFSNNTTSVGMSGSSEQTTGSLASSSLAQTTGFSTPESSLYTTLTDSEGPNASSSVTSSQQSAQSVTAAPSTTPTTTLHEKENTTVLSTSSVQPGASWKPSGPTQQSASAPSGYSDSTTARQTMDSSVNASHSSGVTSQGYSSTSFPAVTSEDLLKVNITKHPTNQSTHVSSLPSSQSAQTTLPETTTSGSMTRPASTSSGQRTQPESTVSSQTTEAATQMNSGEIYITGPVSEGEHHTLSLLLENALNSSLSAYKCCRVTSLGEQTTFVDREGNFVQRFKVSYLSENGNIAVWSKETRDSISRSADNRLRTTEPFSSVGNRVYFGPLDQLRRLDDAYSFDVIGHVTEDYAIAMETAIVGGWSNAHPDCQCRYTISAMTLEPHVGKYGTRLTHVRYFAATDGQSLTPAQSPPPDPRSLDTLLTADAATRLPYPLYHLEGSTTPFDLHHSLLLTHRVKMADSEGRELLATLRQAWENYVVANTSLCASFRCDVKVAYVKPDLYYKADGRVLSQLDYFVMVSGHALDPKLHSGPPEDSLRLAGIPVCACVATPVYHVDVLGSLVWSEAQTLGNTLMRAAGRGLGGRPNSADVIGRTPFLSVSGSQITRISLIPSDHSPRFSPPDFETAYNMAEDGGFRLTKHPIRRQYTVALDGVIRLEETVFVKSYIRKSWELTNTGQVPGSAISVNVTDVDSSYYSDKSNNRVTVMAYTVNVARADSSLTLIDLPSLASLQAGFDTSAYQLCACVPLRARRLPLVGPVDPHTKTPIEEAIGKAWRQANPDFGGNLTVNIRHVLTNRTGKNGEEVTEVVYTLTPKPGTVPAGFRDRDLRVPANESVTKALQEVNPDLGLYANHRGDSDTPWEIPVGVVIALLLVPLVVSVFVFIVRDQRRRRSREVKQRVEQLDGYDEEHFSSEPEFHNPTFVVDDPDLHQARSGTYFVTLLSQDGPPMPAPPSPLPDA